jgi:hypothetical protein
MSMRDESTRQTKVRVTYGVRNKVCPGSPRLGACLDQQRGCQRQQEQEASALSEVRNLKGNGGCGEHIDTRGAERSRVQGELG